MDRSIKNDLLLKTLRGEKTLYTPVWLMRQAGRYLPEYRTLRDKAGSFLNLCKNPEWAAEITLQPLKRYPLDAVIFFSDILTVPDAMGLELKFLQNKGPIFDNPLRTQNDINRLPEVDLSKLSYVFDGIKLCKSELKGAVPLIGFCGSAFTIACYMIQGEGNKMFQMVRHLLYRSPEILHSLLEKCTNALIPYMVEQVHAGADVLQIFDTWGGLLSTPTFNAFSLRYTEKLIQGIKAALGNDIPPIICFTKDATLAWYKSYKDIGATAVSVDWRYELSDVAEFLPKFPLQGNIDPFLLFADDDTIVRRINEVLNRVPISTPHIFNLGHGIDKETPLEKVSLLIEQVHRYSRTFPNR